MRFYRNSLLLGKLAYQIRKATGVNIPVATLFTNSTIKMITSLIDASGPNPNNTGVGLRMQSQSEKTLVGANGPGSETTLPPYEYSYPDDPQIQRENNRGQNHPISLLIQALPFVFFYPLKAALTCTLVVCLLLFSDHLSKPFRDRLASHTCRTCTPYRRLFLGACHSSDHCDCGSSIIRCVLICDFTTN
jgi:hypothetical protein